MIDDAIVLDPDGGLHEEQDGVSLQLCDMHGQAEVSKGVPVAEMQRPTM
jgi:hypothetical protein